MNQHFSHSQSHDVKLSSDHAARDPVCGMTVDAPMAKHQYQYNGRTFHFCSAGCRQKFVTNPVAYLQPTPAKDTGLNVPGASYTCPMHPEIRQDHPGNCPICGMALEPMEPAAQLGENQELRDMRRRFWGAIMLSIPVVALALAEIGRASCRERV